MYGIPSSVTELFQNIQDGKEFVDYKVVDVDKNDSTGCSNYISYFIEKVGIKKENIAENLGDRVIVKHPLFKNRVIIDYVDLSIFLPNGLYWRTKLDSK